ncbi:MAG: NAD(P)/FAD-dependent oxidoreductase [Caldilineaceae bacterium]|nr:NAD(P)/FAD-dependent oxidoreductase [Caldilineaceae bacterium]
MLEQTLPGERSPAAGVYDVAVIGAGVVGCAIARLLSHHVLRCVLVEAGPDVGTGTSKANTAIWHTGFDAAPGTLEARLLRRSYPQMATYMAETGVAVERLGGLLLAWNDDQMQALPAIQARAQENGVTDVYPLPPPEICAREPHLQPGVLGGLCVPGESILCPFTLPLALATEAVVNGVTLLCNWPVQGIDRLPNADFRLRSGERTLQARYVVNAAGLYADSIEQMLGYRRFTVTPRRGELIIFDKAARRLVNHVLLPVPTAITKGVLISPTIYGNVLLGPTAEDIHDKQDRATTAAGLAAVWDKGRALLPALIEEEVTAVYAGLRAATEHKDYQILAHPDERYICVGGIRSTGVSASLGIADYVRDLLADARLTLPPKPDWQRVQMPYLGETGTRPYQSAQRIAANPDYGRMVCFCERVSLGELLDACHSPIPARTLDGLRRRTRALQGRCQGFNCQAALSALLARETGQTVAALLGLEAGCEQ